LLADGRYDHPGRQINEERDDMAVIDPRAELIG
jgi:hypothetical protein